MIKITVTNNTSGKKYTGEFETLEDLEAWKLDNISNDSWGKPGEYSIIETDISAEVQAKKDKENARKLLRDKLKTQDLTLQEINELLRD